MDPDDPGRLVEPDLGHHSDLIPVGQKLLARGCQLINRMMSSIDRNWAAKRRPYFAVSSRVAWQALGNDLKQITGEETERADRLGTTPARFAVEPYRP